MSKFCTTCGFEMPNEAAVCSQCGTPQAGAAPQAAPMPQQPPVYQQPPMYQQPPQQPQKSSVDFKSVVKDVTDGLKSTGSAVVGKVKEKKKMFMIIGIATVVVIAAILVFGLLFGSSVESAVEDCLDLALAYDPDAVSSIAPDEAWEYFEKECDFTEDDAEAFLESYQADLLLMAYGDEDLGEDIEVASFEITSESEMTTKKFNELCDDLKEYYGIPRKDIDAGYTVKVKYTVAGDKDEMSDDDELRVFKMGSQYYVYEALSFVKYEIGSLLEMEANDPDAFASYIEAATAED